MKPMKRFAYPVLAGSAVLLLVFALGLVVTQATQLYPTIVPPSNSNKTETASAPQQGISKLAQSASDAASATTPQKCPDLDSCMKQIEAQVRTIEKEIEAKLPKLERAAEEVEMSSPELSKLSGLSEKLQGKQAELETRAEELRARAEELAQEMQEKVQANTDQMFAPGPRVYAFPSDEGGWLGVEIGEVTAEQAKDLRL